jgi:hypothetical protein
MVGVRSLGDAAALADESHLGVVWFWVGASRVGVR